MKKGKLFLTLLIAVSMVFVFSACGQNEEDATTDAHTEVTSDLSMADDVKAFLEKVDMEYAYNLAETLSYDEKYQDNELGWRSAGSDAEHRAADFLVDEMKSIGLVEVEKVGVDVDKFQFGDSKLTIEGTDIDLTPASYQCNGTDKDGITAEIVDVGTGFEADYDGKDVKGKIVLAKVDQSNEAWIDSYIRQANEEGAAAIVSWADSGYGELNKDTINVQDICCDDLIPTAAISANQAADIKEAIKAGNSNATLMLDAVLEKGEGTTYNVTGRIKGKSSDQQIVIASHYDKYWYGFQDNSCAVAFDFALLKAMIDSGYVPENDIVIAAHGAEEWGASNTQFDWTTGAWGMVHDAHPEWATKTIAMINSELPAFVPEGNKLNVVSVPEFRTLVGNLIADSGLIVKSGDVTIKDKTTDANNMEDGVSYRWHGIPYMLNGFEDETFISQRYHTSSDDKETYNEDILRSNINMYGAMAIYMDKTPAIELDMSATCDDLTANLDDELASEAGVDVGAYKTAIADLQSSVDAHNDKIKAVNEKYETAMKDGATDEEIASIRDEAKVLNKVSLKGFKTVQDEFMKADDVDVYIGHPNVNNNANVLKGVIAGLENKELYAEDEESGALDQAWNLNAGHDYGYYNFSKKVVDDIEIQYDADKVDKDLTFWGTNKLVPVYYVGDTTYKLVHSDEKDIDFEASIKVYNEALTQALGDIKNYTDSEITGMKKIADILK